LYHLIIIIIIIIIITIIIIFAGCDGSSFMCYDGMCADSTAGCNMRCPNYNSTPNVTYCWGGCYEYSSTLNTTNSTNNDPNNSTCELV
jgi:hypothetical protein